MRKVGNDRFAAVARIAPDQVVEHAALGAQVIDGARLVHIEMRQAVGDAIAKHAPAFRVWLRRAELEFSPVELAGNVREYEAGGQPIGSREDCAAATLDEMTTGPA